MSASQYPSVEADPRDGVTPAVAWLIAANVGMYFLQIALFGTQTVADWFALTSESFPNHWWGVGTYMFVHGSLVHLAMNMVTLWMFGPRVERVFGTRSFTYFYLWCGLGGAICQLLFVHNGGVIGASGAVVGVVLAYALRWPDDDVYLFAMIPMRTRWLAIWMIAINIGMALLTMAGHTNSTTAWMTHVGGLAFAWLYLNAPLGPSLERIRRHVAMVPDTPEPRPIPRMRRVERRETGAAIDEVGGSAIPRTTDDVVAQSNAIVTSQSTTMMAVPEAPKSIANMDAVLDKISKEGIQSLTPGERRLLEEVSRRLRNS